MSERDGVEVDVLRWERLEPWYVFRLVLTSESPDVPGSVIVKSLRDHPTGFRTDPEQVLTEACALEFVAELGLDLVPQVLAYQLEACLVVLEDLAPRQALFDLIRNGDPRAADGLSSFAHALGSLGVKTVGRSDEYYERRSALGPVDRQSDRLRFLGWGWSDTRQYCEELGVPIRGEAETEMIGVFESFLDPGPFLTLSNGDAGANNYLVDGSDGRIIDFEFAGYRHSLMDASNLYMPGSMWMTVSDPIAAGLESIYRAALSEGIPEAADDERYGIGIAGACCASAVERLHRYPRLDERAPGHESRRQMVSTIEAAVWAAEAHSSLAHVSGWLKRVAEALRLRWPDADVVFDPSAGYSIRV